MTATHGPGRVPGVRRLTDAIDRLDGRDGAQETRTGREGSEGGVGADEPSEGLRWVDMFGVWPDHPEADDDQVAATIMRLTHERDRAREECGHEKAMRASIREEMYGWIQKATKAEAKVARVEAMIEDFRNSPTNRDYCRHVADSFESALADRPTDG